MQRSARPALFEFLIFCGIICVGFASSASASAPQVRTQAPGYYRMMLGNFEITALSDGTHPFPDDVLTTPKTGTSGDNKDRAKLLDINPKKADALLRAAYLTIPTEGSINAFLINTGSKLILIDTGAGTLYGPCCGHLIANLEAAGYRPDEVDEIFLTHLHADHVGGVAPGGKIAFPNATVWASKIDADYWLNPANEKVAPSFLRPMFEGDKASLKPYIALGRFHTFIGAPELAPGIWAVPAPGHTPGHTFYKIESNNQELVVWGDVVHVAAIQFPDPAVAIEYDSNEQEATETRKAIFAAAVKGRFWIAAAHISFPGLGHVGLSGTDYVWVPAPYTTEFPPPAP
jgi:glyoxylase-like metal-dependent hydrolase (beta-lactamase superfamily II)